MYAIVKCGGKQLKVAQGDKIVVEKLDAEVGKSVALGDVLLVSNNGNLTVGTPIVAGAKVMAKVEAQQKGEKVIVFKKRRRQNYRRKNGHRQLETAVVIESISL